MQMPDSRPALRMPTRRGLLAWSLSCAAVGPVAAQPAAPSVAATLLDGSAFSSERGKGKVLFINFWATRCGPCVAEMPEIGERPR